MQILRPHMGEKNQKLWEVTGGSSAICALKSPLGDSITY